MVRVHLSFLASAFLLLGVNAFASERFTEGNAEDGVANETQIPLQEQTEALRPPQRGVYLGSTYMTNQRSGDWVDLDSPGRTNCRLDRLKIHVAGDDARIDLLVLQFGNGSTQNVHLRTIFRHGSESRWINLEGHDRCVRGAFVFGQSLRGPRTSRIDFYGRYR